jgi:hypothetical protein
MVSVALRDVPETLPKGLDSFLSLSLRACVCISHLRGRWQTSPTFASRPRLGGYSLVRVAQLGGTG